MKIEKSLLDAYGRANYHILSSPSFTLKINEFSSEIEFIHLKNSVKYSAFITAHNPFSQLIAKEKNDSLQQSLVSDIKTLGLSFIEGWGQDGNPDSEWKEASILVLGIDFKVATSLAIKYEQNAFVWIESDCIPKLILPFSDSSIKNFE